MQPVQLALLAGSLLACASVIRNISGTEVEAVSKLIEETIHAVSEKVDNSVIVNPETGPLRIEISDHEEEENIEEALAKETNNIVTEPVKDSKSVVLAEKEAKKIKTVAQNRIILSLTSILVVLLSLLIALFAK